MLIQELKNRKAESKVKIRFDATEKRKPTADDGADCVNVILSNVYYDAKHFGIVHLLNIDLPLIWTLGAEQGNVRRFCRVVTSGYLVLVILA